MFRQWPAGQEVSGMVTQDVRSNRSGKKEYLVDISFKSNLDNQKDSVSWKSTAWIADEVLEKSLKSAREMAMKKKPSGQKTTVEQSTPEKLRTSRKTTVKQNTPEKLRTSRKTTVEQNTPQKLRTSRKEQAKKSENMSSRAGRSKSTERSNSRGRDKHVRFQEDETGNVHQGMVTRSRAKAEKTQLQAVNY